MTQDPVNKVLKDIGLTDRETELYIFLGKHGALKGVEIARRIRLDKGEVYHILRSLQSKGLVESTLQTPTRFAIAPFEKVLNQFIKARRDEAALVESTKGDLLNYWNKISKTNIQPSSEKFVVIEGNSKIYPKIFQMINETKQQLSVTSSVSGLLRADQSDLFDAAFEHSSKSKTKFLFLTEISEENVAAMKYLLKRLPTVGLNFRGRSPDFGLRSYPRMVIRDDEEILFFITPVTKNAFMVSQDDVCLWTNCRSLVQSFIGVFEDLWGNSTDLNKKIAEVETGGLNTQTHITYNAEIVKSKCFDCLRSAKDDVLVLTSSEGLVELGETLRSIRLSDSDISIRIMAPIASENFKLSQELSKFYNVKHIRESYLTTIIIDSRYLFQLKTPSAESLTQERIASNSSFYTDNFDYVQRAKSKLDELWRKASTPSVNTLESIVSPSAPATNPLPDQALKCGYVKSQIRVEDYEEGKLTESYVINKIISGKKAIVKTPRDVVVTYGSDANAVIHPPSHFGLPDMLVTLAHNNKQSSAGAEDSLVISLWLETPQGHAFVPVASVSDNPITQEGRRKAFTGTPAGQNSILLEKDQLNVQVQGNTLFAGWTVPIPLYPPPYTLPPCCILFEGHGKLKTCRMKTTIPSGHTQVYEVNKFEAFVTLFHPASKYSGPGTDGCLHRESIVTTYPLPIS